MRIAYRLLVSIPLPTVRRLSLYLREAEAMLAGGMRTVSSSSLSDRLGVTDAQIRRDLGYLGVRGRPGIGYRLSGLIKRLRSTLGVDRSRNVALIGAGRIGRALMAYPSFAARGFRIVAVFDVDRALVGASIDGHVVQPLAKLDELIEEALIEMAIIAVPAEAAQEVATRLESCGVSALLNFAPCRLSVQVPVVDVDLVSSLEELASMVTEVPDH
ncbi:MAG: redox-sensing transcriptional repressor Rex [Phycisphaerales bacterium]|nr:redox-sensing transcriptional repressor Rex [Phycisphaerales bacterium]